MLLDQRSDHENQIKSEWFLTRRHIVSGFVWRVENFRREQLHVLGLEQKFIVSVRAAERRSARGREESTQRTEGGEKLARPPYHERRTCHEHRVRCPRPVSHE